MSWIQDHLQLLLMIGGAIAWWLNQRNQKPEEDEQAPPPRDASFDDPDVAERARRIREEIQRKIEERTRGGHVPPLPETRPEPVAYQEPPPLVHELPSRPPAVPEYGARPSRQEVNRHAEILEQQAALAEQLRMADEMKRSMQKRVAFETATQAGDPALVQQRRNVAALRADLRSPAALRRAFLLREVLGPPVALR